MGGSSSAFQLLRTVRPIRQSKATSRLATAHLISSPSVVLDFSSTRSLIQSRTKRLCWLSEIVCASSLLTTSRELFLLHLQSVVCLTALVSYVCLHCIVWGPVFSLVAFQ